MKMVDFLSLGIENVDKIVHTLLVDCTGLNRFGRSGFVRIGRVMPSRHKFDAHRKANTHGGAAANSRRVPFTGKLR